MIGRRGEKRALSVGMDARVRRAFPALQFGADAFAWAIAVPAATLLRYDLRIGPIDVFGVVIVMVLAIVCQAGIGLGFGLYRRHYNYGSLDEVRVLGMSIGAVAVIATVVVQAAGGSWVPRSVPVLAAFLALALTMVVRFAARLVEERHSGPSLENSEPVIVFGAGASGEQIIKSLMRSSDQRYRPLAILDDDLHKASLRINGLRVRGTRHDAVAVAEEHGARSILIAAPSLSGESLRELTDPFLEADLTVLILPRVSEMIDDTTSLQIRPLTIEDLLGRSPANVDLASISGYVTDRRVLVTGAGGSIGSELCRQLHSFGLAELFMLDRDESGLHSTQMSIAGRPSLGSPSLVLADIRDRERIASVFRELRPDVVFHAAALKHQPLLEKNPSEAWKTNVVGTRNVLDASVDVGVERFVNISSDKAADPAGVLGYSKRICERLTAETAERVGRDYVSVRFGNVLGSRGSMLGVFEHQIARGGPVTVTDPDITRYFMTVSEAVALVIQAGAIGTKGEALVLDMGSPIRIQDVARRLIRQSGRNIEVVYTGLRDGEKLHEVLLGPGEADCRPFHKLISHTSVPPLSFSEAAAAACADGNHRDVSIEMIAAAALSLDGAESRWAAG
ncbi:MAG: dTDP-glucose 4,6-dehydratase [Ilumatobacter sp.]|jgi:dTDP-glucose 4,6-dehydratase